jgi:hypothetical protein
LKTVKRDYVSSDCFETYDNVLPDYATYKLSEPPGWPLKISLDSQSYTNTSNPSVNGYEFLTFSGVQINTVTGTLDVWYEHFRFSDKDIFKTYSAAEPPPPLTSTTVTEKVLKLVSAMSLLQAELRSLAANTTGSFNLQGELSYNPDPVLKARKKDLEDLKDKLEEEIEDIIGNTVTGVRVD